MRAVGRTAAGVLAPVELVIPVEPVPKPRPKVIKTRRGQVFTVTPGKCGETEIMIRKYVMEHAKVKFPKPTPLRLEVTFYVPKPKSLPKSRKHPSTRPDLDNYLKLFKDALNKYLWDDDSQIVEVKARKAYGDPPRIEMRVEALL